MVRALESKRIFLAIKIPDNLSDEVSQFQDNIRHIGLDAKFVEKENLHFNLKFFGSIDGETIESITHSVEGVLKQVKPFKVEVKSLNTFPNNKFLRVLWIGVGKGKQNIINLHSLIENSLSKLGFPKEDKGFVPHLTLCRIHSQRNIGELKETIKANSDMSFGEFYVGSIFLIQSRLSSKGPVYIDLKKFELGE